MIYLQKSKKKKKKIIFAGFAILLFLVIASLLVSKAQGPLSSGMHAIGLPFWHVGNFLSNNVNIMPGFIRSKSAVIAENEALRAEVILNREKLLNFEILQSEHAKLLEDYGRSGSENKIISTVLVRPPQTPYDMLILDSGSSDGVSKDDVIYSMGGIILGRITEVSEHSSNATLFSRTDLITPAFFERTNLAVSLKGIGGGSFEVEVPQEADVQKGDTLIAPELTPSVIGVVSLVESSVKNAFKRVLIQSPTNISYVRFVLVHSKK